MEEEYDYRIADYLKRDPIRLRVRHETEWTTKNVLILIFGIVFIATVIGAFVADQVWRTQPQFVITQ
ncbi:MAG: hypothetical protein JO001_05875 [Alphaproteobacteria bacterium]|nr:hypothetical protein [Alphaproteobacteria bacterium]